ncbi:MAG: tetratricopeptide repeat protein [Acidobacteriaceae bacterium]
MTTAPTTPRTANSRQPLTPAERNQRRHLIFQDTLALLSLMAISIVVGVLTYYFFHSFQQHRSVLEKRWFARGQQALSQGNPQAAVEDFRSALSLSTADPTYELALAEALAASNRNEEAYTYFSALQNARPGDGFLNLQLARLAVKAEDPAQAIRHYRAALTGLWYGQGATQRFQIRLELAKYLMSLGRNTDAQGDLLTAEGNSLDHPAEMLQVASLLEQADDPSDAYITYRRVQLHAAATPSQVLQSLLAEARVATAMGQYKQAATALSRYNMKARQNPKIGTAEQRRDAEQQLDQLQRLLQLAPLDGLAPRTRARRILQAAQIAHRRYTSCSAMLQPQNLSPEDAAALAALAAQWSQIGATNATRLAANAALQQALLSWTNQTEILTARLCGPPTGDDALLYQLAQAPDKSE